MGSTTQKPSILIIDDDTRLTNGYRMLLEEEGFDVTVEDDGEKALGTAQASKPDLILLDLMLPKKDGLQILHEIKDDEALRNVPVIVLTALVNELKKDESVSGGVVAYFEKVSTEPEDLLRTIKETLRT